MRFDYDPEKSAANKAKHGIDFEEAQALWADDHAVMVPSPTANETRYAVIGKIAGKHWLAVCTVRGDRLRLISVRRARHKEIERYEGT